METKNQIINKVERVNPFANMNEVKVITNMVNKNEIDDKTKKDILKYCKTQLYEVEQYLIGAKTIDDVEKRMQDFAECNWSHDYQINDEKTYPNDNISYFSFIFDQILIDGYVTPFGVILSKEVVYNTFDEDCTLYKVDTEFLEVNLMN